MHKAIGIIGYGNMGEAIGQRLKAKYQIWVFDKDKSKTDHLSNISVASSVTDLVNRVKAVILAVKPQDFEALLLQLKESVQDKLVVSIAAGKPTEYIEDKLGRVGVIRVMPNLPAKVGEGMIVLCKGKYSDQADLDFAQELFKCLGKTMLIKEDLMPAATAISGSGPGFFYDLIQDKPKADWQDYAKAEFFPALSASAEENGFSLEQAQLLADVTANGSIVLLEQTGLSPGVLCIQVTSPGGTTEAGLKELKQDIEFLGNAVKAALKRAKELSRE